jgi:hypothetical protein
MKNLRFLVVAGLVFTSIQFTAAQTFYVSAEGSDAQAGTLEAPFATLEQAQEAVRAYLKEHPACQVTVQLRGGKYFLEQGLRFGAEDSGRKGLPAVYQAYQDEEVRLIGGKQLQPEWFEKVTRDTPVWQRLSEEARGQVVQVNLKEHGISDFGKLRRRGFAGSSAVAHLELIFNDQVMQLARYPNSGFIQTATAVDEVTFHYEDERPGRWLTAEDVWAFGYWKYGWADTYVPIREIDPKKRIIRLGEKPAYEIEKDKPWYALNLQEELDMPGEWYLERSSGILYFYPPAELQGAEILVSTLGENREYLLSVRGAHDLVFRNITFEAGRFGGVNIEDCEDVVLDGCTIRNMGEKGVHVKGKRCGVVNSTLYGVGSAGIVISGGDRQTLERSANFVSNTHVHHFSRWERTYTPAILMSGVGITVSHNLLHDAPHTAIFTAGMSILLSTTRFIMSVRSPMMAELVLYNGQGLGRARECDPV